MRGVGRRCWVSSAPATSRASLSLGGAEAWSTRGGGFIGTSSSCLGRKAVARRRSDVPNTKAVLELLGPHFTTKNDLCDLFKQRWTFRDAGEDKKLTSWKKFAKWARSCSPDKLQLKISTTDLASDSFQFFKKASGGQSQQPASSTEAPVRPALH